jgi:hypothetical protein
MLVASEPTRAPTLASTRSSVSPCCWTWPASSSVLSRTYAHARRLTTSDQGQDLPCARPRRQRTTKTVWWPNSASQSQRRRSPSLRGCSPRRSLRSLARSNKGRRLGAAEARIAWELAALPEGFWLVERDVRVDGRRIPFVVIGATGVFLICASYGAWTLDDLHVMSELGD